MTEDDFEEWLLWLATMKEPDGSVDLEKHPEVAAFIKSLKWLPLLNPSG